MENIHVFLEHHFALLLIVRLPSKQPAVGLVVAQVQA